MVGEIERTGKERGQDLGILLGPNEIHQRHEGTVMIIVEKRMSPAANESMKMMTLVGGEMMENERKDWLQGENAGEATPRKTDAGQLRMIVMVVIRGPQDATGRPEMFQKTPKREMIVGRKRRSLLGWTPTFRASPVLAFLVARHRLES